MNKYLLTALYVMAGCAVAVPSGRCGGIPVGADVCRLLTAVGQEGAETDDPRVIRELIALLTEEAPASEVQEIPEAYHFSVCLFSAATSKQGWTEHPIRAPGMVL